MSEIKLTPKQENFCQEYIKTGNASEAYRISYNTKTKSENTINVNASKLLSETKISLRVKELKEQLEEKHNITKDMILKELANIAFVRESEFYHDDGRVKQLSELTDEQKSALASYQYKKINLGDGEYIEVPIFKAQDKLKAIETLNKMLGYNEPDRVEHSGETTQNIKTLDDFYAD